MSGLMLPNAPEGTTMRPRSPSLNRLLKPAAGACLGGAIAIEACFSLQVYSSLFGNGRFKFDMLHAFLVGALIGSVGLIFLEKTTRTLALFVVTVLVGGYAGGAASEVVLPSVIKIRDGDAFSYVSESWVWVGSLVGGAIATVRLFLEPLLPRRSPFEENGADLHRLPFTNRLD